METTMKHTEACIQAQAAWKQEREAYEELWGPEWCEMCYGNGYHISRYDPSPSGVSLGSGYMEDVDFCSHCVEAGICPRCGRLTLNEDGTHCEFCDWDEEESQGLPEPPECWCWEQDFNENWRNEPIVDWIEEAMREKEEKDYSGYDFNTGKPH